MHVTRHTRIRGSLPALDAFGALYGTVQRRLHAELMKGRAWTGDLQTSFYRQFGITSVHLGQIHAELVGKHDAAKASAKTNVETLVAKHDAKARLVHVKEKALAKARKDLPVLRARLSKAEAKLARAKPGRSKTVTTDVASLWKRIGKTERMIAKYPFAIHQHRRKVASLGYKIEIAKARIAVPSICFGTRDLFGAQHDLKGNGHKNHGAWLRDWRDSRSTNVFVSGDKSYPTGNPFVRPRVEADGSLTLCVLLPKALALHDDPSVKRTDYRVDPKSLAFEIRDVRFPHGHDGVLASLKEGGAPISWRFVRDAKSWRVFVSFDEQLQSVRFDGSRGCLAVDLNVGHVAATHVDRHGNARKTYRFPLVTYGRSSEQSLDTTRKVAKEIAVLAELLGLPVASESLDFKERKATLGMDEGKRYARMLSSFAYSSFGSALVGACLRQRVGHEAVNPAFTSVIGRVKYARLRGLSVHHAAALSIGRRAIGLDDRIPSSFELTFDDGDRGTLVRPVRIGRRHVWSRWRRVSSSVKRDLAGHYGAKRAARAERVDHRRRDLEAVDSAPVPGPGGTAKAPRTRRCEPSAMRPLHGYRRDRESPHGDDRTTGLGVSTRSCG